MNRVSVHRGKETHRPQPACVDRRRGVDIRRRSRRIHHEEPDEPARMPARGERHRLGVARHARDERRARHAVTIELDDPAVRQLLDGPR